MLEIAGPKTKSLYRIEFLGAERGIVWGVVLHHQEKLESYRVTLGTDRIWRCSCPAWKFDRNHRPHSCKHVQNTIKLRKLLAGLVSAAK